MYSFLVVVCKTPRTLSLKRLSWVSAMLSTTFMMVQAVIPTKHLQVYVNLHLPPPPTPSPL